MNGKLLSEKDLELAKKQVETALEQLNLSERVSLKEIENTLTEHGVLHESPLLLGLLARSLEEANESAVSLLLPSLTIWKNFLPSNELGGLSPVEFEKQNPKGPIERDIINNLMRSFENKLQEMKDTSSYADSDIEKSFIEYRDEYFNLIPAHQPFSDIPKMLSHRQIIAEEKNRLGYPIKNIEKLSIKVFVENIGEKTGMEMAQLYDCYLTAMDKLSQMQIKPKLRNIDRVRKLYKQLKELEQYMKCRKDAYEYYGNLGNTGFLVGDTENAKQYLQTAIDINPSYTIAKQNLENFERFEKELDTE